MRILRRILTRVFGRRHLPSQRMLDALFARVTRMRVVDGGMADGVALGTHILLETRDSPVIAALHSCMTIVEDPRTFGHCMCRGDPAVELYGRFGLLATIGLHHGRSIRWDEWQCDALLRDGRQVLVWLARQHVAGPLETFEADQRQAEADRQAAVRWQEAIPASLRPYWNQMQTQVGGFLTFVPAPSTALAGPVSAPVDQVAALLNAMEAGYPDSGARILKLFEWYGSGEGAWSGYPAYEGVPERLLFEFSTRALVDALSQGVLTPRHVEGAARYFAGYWFNALRRDDAPQLPTELKSRLLEHSLQSTDADKIARARHAFAG